MHNITGFVKRACNRLATGGSSVRATRKGRALSRPALSRPRYVQARRIQEAKRLMENPDTSISEICFRCGFNSLTHFYRIFLQSEGCSPSQFRAKEKGEGTGRMRGERGKARR